MAESLDNNQKEVDLKQIPEVVEEPEHLEKLKVLDVVHNDEALKVLARHAEDEVWTEDEEKRLRRKIDRRLLSIICVSYALQYYDKAMLGQTVCKGLSFIPISEDKRRIF